MTREIWRSGSWGKDMLNQTCWASLVQPMRLSGESIAS